jgi:hypothetical protein
MAHWFVEEKRVIGPGTGPSSDDASVSDSY